MASKIESPRMIYWGTALAQTDIGGLWVWAKVRPWWYWRIRRVRLFLYLVWRRYETTRLTVEVAWAVSKVAETRYGPWPVHKFPVRENWDATE